MIPPAHVDSTLFGILSIYLVTSCQSRDEMSFGDGLSPFALENDRNRRQVRKR